MTLLHRTLDAAPVASLADYLDSGGGEALANSRALSGEQIIEIVSAAGLRGRGGGGFPAAVKLTTVAASRSPEVATTTVVNAAEGEPGTFKDRAIIRTNPYRVIEGALVAARAVGSSAIKIGTKASFAREVQRLRRAIDECTAAGWFDEISIDIVLGPKSYLFGEETALLEVIERRQPFPRVTPPFRRGIEEHDTRSAGGVGLAAVGGSEEPPALVENVESLANMALILDKGVDWFREVGTEKSPGTVVCTVTGATRRQGVGEIALGTTLREAIHLIGWGPRPGHGIGLVLSGTASAMITPELLDTPLTYEDMSAAGTGLGSAGFWVFDEETDPVAVAQGVSRFLAVESCGQCEHCKNDGLALSSLLDTLRTAEMTDRQMDDLIRRVDTVPIGARCNLARQQAEVVGSLLAQFPAAVQAHARGTAKPAESVYIAPLADITAGRSILDADQSLKQPDWSMNPTDSGTPPAALLGDTPVYIEPHEVAQRWPEWDDSPSEDLHPLALLDEAHELLDRLVSDAFHAEPAARDDAISKMAHIMRLHLDVVQRVLYPMADRYGGAAGEDFADDAETQEAELLRALRDVERATDDDSRAAALHELGDALVGHVTREEAIVAILRETMDPDERATLAEGLAVARSTSTT